MRFTKRGIRLNRQLKLFGGGGLRSASAQNDPQRHVRHPVRQSRAAEWLGINRNTLRRKLVEHKLIK